VISQTQIFIAANDMIKGAIYESDQNNIDWLMISDQGFEQGVSTVSIVLEHNTILAGARGIYLNLNTTNNGGN